MTEEKGIQITKGSTNISKVNSQSGIEISRSGKPISGAAPELLEVAFRCASKRKPFKILLEGQPTGSKNYRYKVVHILKGEEPSQQKAISWSRAKKHDININEIKGIHNVECPHCGNKSGIIRCQCGGLSCRGGVRREGNRQYQECPWCRSVGIISGYFKELSGERSGSRQAQSNRGSAKKQIETTGESVQKLTSGNKEVMK